MINGQKRGRFSSYLRSIVWRPKMLGFGFQRRSKTPLNLLFSSFISCFFVFFFQLTLAMVPRFLNSYSLLAMLAISAIVLLAAMGFGRCCRRILRVSASAPAFVFFNILFIWGVYIVVIRQAIPLLADAVLNAECALLIIGLYSILSGDPGIVMCGSSCLDGLNQSANSKTYPHSEEDEFSMSGVCHEQPAVMIENGISFSRIRYCNICKAHIRGFDHHCPAFGSCIGQKNHVLFMILLVGFVTTEASYIVCSTKFISKSRDMHNIGLETSLPDNLAISTMLFSLLQVLWQVQVF